MERERRTIYKMGEYNEIELRRDSDGEIIMKIPERVHYFSDMDYVKVFCRDLKKAATEIFSEDEDDECDC